MLFGRVHPVQFHLIEQAVGVVNERQIHYDTLRHHHIDKALRDPFAVALVSDLLADFGQVVLVIGILNVCQQLSPFALSQCLRRRSKSQVERSAAGYP